MSYDRLLAIEYRCGRCPTGVTTLPEVEASSPGLSESGKGSEDVDEVAECPEVDTDRAEKPDCIGWV